MDNPESWKITVEERNKHNASFMQLGPANGTHLTGEQAKPFFLKSGLPTNVLGTIWMLADYNKDGKLDKKEFSIACFLIKRVLTSPQGASVLPQTLPSSLLIDPLLTTSTSASNLLSSTIPQIVPTTATSPPTTINPTAPLFQPAFNSTTSAPNLLAGTAIRPPLASSSAASSITTMTPLVSIQPISGLPISATPAAPFAPATIAPLITTTSLTNPTPLISTSTTLPLGSVPTPLVSANL
jgi:epidermal growth factor receptor substrate 15